MNGGQQPWSILDGSPLNSDNSPLEPSQSLMKILSEGVLVTDGGAVSLSQGILQAFSNKRKQSCL
ncbi:MAG TPA: hypothetical protein DGB85_05880 [Deltaproteobacteria bacterium]|nr:hypothetical protein [Deltaproteobacteria bacterium]